MSDLSLGALSMQLKVDAEGLDASMKKAIGGLDKIEQKADATAKKTEDVGKTLQKALKGEVLVNAMNRVSSSLGSLGKDFEGLAFSAQSTGAVMQGLFQGGIVGAAVATGGVLVTHLLKPLAEAQALIDSATKAAAASTAAMAAGYAKVAESLEEVTRKLLVQNDAKALGITLSEAEFRLKAQELVGSIASLRSSAAGSRALGEERQRTVGNTESTRGFFAAAASDDALADQKAEQLKLIESTLRLDKATKAAAKPLSDFAKALKEAREWTLKNAGLSESPGEAARADAARAAAMRLGTMRNPDGSITSEARDRAARNAGYRANASDTLVLDKPLDRGDGVGNRFADRATEVTDQIFADISAFAVDFSDALEAGARMVAQVAPKSAEVLGSILRGDFVGAITSALSHSVEFQAVGKALDSGLVEIINAISEVLRPAVPVITMAIRAVVEAAKVVMGIVDIVASALQLDTVFAIVFEVVKVLAAVLSVGAFAIKYALDGMQNALKNFMIWLLSLPIFLGAFTQQVEDMKKSLVVQGDFVAGASKAWNDIMKIGFNAEIALVGVSDAADKVAASFLNLPAGFKTAAAIYGATSASGAPFGGFAPPSVSPGMPGVAPSVSGASSPSGGGDVLNFYGPINIEGDEGLKVGAKRAARQRGMSGNGTTGGREAEPGAWDGVWDLTP